MDWPAEIGSYPKDTSDEENPSLPCFGGTRYRFGHGVDFRGILNGDNYSGYADLAPEFQFIPPVEDLDPDNDSEHIDLVVRSEFFIERCAKTKGRFTCHNLGYVWLDTLHYHFVSF